MQSAVYMRRSTIRSTDYAIFLILIDLPITSGYGESQVETENRRIIEWVKELYEEQNGILGYRQMTITINRDKNTQYNVKRIRRLMRYLRLKVCLPQKTVKLYSVHTGNNSRKHFES